MNDNFVHGNFWNVAHTKKAETFTFTKKGKKIVNTKTLINEVFGNKKHSKPYSRLIKENSEGEDEIIGTPKEVAKSLVEVLEKWMGKGRKKWYTGHTIEKNTAEGRALRMLISEKGADIDLKKHNIPRKFKTILEHLQKVEGITNKMFENCTQHITKEEWAKFWSSVKKGTSPGRSGITADMMSLLPEENLENFRTLVNSCWDPRAGIFDSWKLRVITPIPKIPGNYDINKLRPIVLLDVIQKGFWAIVISRITEVWENNNILHPHQYGSRTNKDATSASLMATLLAEESESTHKNFYAFACDCKRAYDSVETFVGKEMALRRLGVPELIIKMITDMDLNNSAVVYTAFGMTDDILGEEGSFCYERGWTQGASESPSGWVSTYDILLKLLDTHTTNADLGCHLTTISDKRHATAITAIAYVDDALLLAGSRHGIEYRANIASLYFEFVGIQFNPDKSEVIGMEWIDGKAVDLASQSWNPIIYDSNVLFANGNITLHPQVNGHIQPPSVTNMCNGKSQVKVTALNTGIKYLGNTWSPKPDLKAISDIIAAEIEQNASAINHFSLEPESILYLATAVSKAKFMYRATCLNLTETQGKNIEQKIKKTFMKSIKMSSVNTHLLSTPHSLASIGWQPWFNTLMIKRLEMVTKHIRRDSVLGALLRNSYRRYLRLSGDSELHNPESTLHWENNPWLHHTLNWAKTHHITLHGKGLEHEKWTNDVRIIDLAKTTEELKLLKKGCNESKKYWMSQIANTNRMMGIYKKIFQDGKADITLKDLKATYFQTHTEPTPRKGAVMEMDVVIRNPTPQNKDNIAVSVISHMKDDVCFGYNLVSSQALFSKKGRDQHHSQEAYIQSTDGTTGGTKVSIISQLGDVYTIKLHNSNTTQTTQKDKLLPRAPLPSGKSVTNLLSGNWNRTTNLIQEGEMLQWKRQDCIRIPMASTILKNQAIYTIFCKNSIVNHLTLDPKPTTSHTIEDHKFGTLCDMNLELNDHNWTKPEQDEYDTLIGSDGSVKANRGTFAWISSEHNSYKAGGGEINTGGTEIHSFRAESAAILSAMSHLWDPTKPDKKACLTTDNETAKDVYNEKYETLKSLDIWDEISWWKKKWGKNFIVKWGRGHPEEREKNTNKWTGEDWRNHGADRICDMMYYTGKKVSDRDFERGCTWHLKLNKLRIADETKHALDCIVAEKSVTFLSDTSDIPQGIINWDHTGKVLNAKHMPIRSKKSMLNRIFNRGFLHRNMVKKGLYGAVPEFVKLTPYSYETKVWLNNNDKSHCQTCNDNLPEDQEHMLAICKHQEAKKIRSEWLSQLLDYLKTKLPSMEKLIRAHLTLNEHGSISWHQNTKLASLILAGCIPNEWWLHVTSSILTEFNDPPTVTQRKHMDSAISSYDSFLKWHGQHLRKLIWEPLQNLRSKYYKSRGNDEEAKDALNDEGDNTLEDSDPTTWTDSYVGNDQENG